MSSQIIISVAECDSRVALVEDDRLVEFFLAPHQTQDPTGHIYKGRVLKVLPGLAAAFIDVGLERPGYLYVEEAAGQLDDFFQIWLKGEAGEEPEPPPRRLPDVPIQDLLHQGQELLVQVFRGPLANKGARLTTHISLPGHYLVYLPTLGHIGVSRRITEEGERSRLKEILERLKPTEGGLIARTASFGQGLEVLTQERDFLLHLWKKILHRKESSAAPALLFQELEVALRVARDLFTAEVGRLVVDDPQTYEQLLDYFGALSPRFKHRIELYSGPESIFSHFGLEIDWHRLLAPKVWLKSGGYLLIQATEALTAIDVNTGRFTGHDHLENTILQTNLEAAKEIARQLRLRNLGGIIIIDFIDMERPSQREQVYQTFVEALKRDRARTTVLPMSSMGLVEMTRQRLRNSLAQIATEPCLCCEGRGSVLAAWIVAHDLLRLLAAEAQEFPGYHLAVDTHPEVAAILRSRGETLWDRLAQDKQVTVTITEHPEFRRDNFQIVRIWQDRQKNEG